MRDYQDWRRADITARIEALVKDSLEYRRTAERAEEEAKDKLARGRWSSMEALAIRAACNTVQHELSQRQRVNLDEVQALQVELAIRDSPELVAQFGPGRD